MVPPRWNCRARGQAVTLCQETPPAPSLQPHRSLPARPSLGERSSASPNPRLEPGWAMPPAEGSRSHRGGAGGRLRQEGELASPPAECTNKPEPLREETCRAPTPHQGARPSTATSPAASASAAAQPSAPHHQRSPHRGTHRRSARKGRLAGQDRIWGQQATPWRKPRHARVAQARDVSQP